MSEEIKINAKDWEKWLKSVDIKDKKLRPRILAVLKHPFKPIYKDSKSNLVTQGSVNTGGLLKSMSVRVRSRSKQGRLSVGFGGKRIARQAKFKVKVARMKGVRGTGKSRARQMRGGTYFYPVNAGTVMRKTKSGANRGRLGSGDSTWQKGFADRAVLKNLSKFPGDLAKGFQKLMDEQTEKANRAS